MAVAKPKLYMETSIPSYLTARPSRDLIVAGHQQITQDWWDLKRNDHELFASQVVLDEIAFGDPAMAQLRLEILQAIPLLQVTGEVKELARKVLASGLLPATAEPEGYHAEKAKGNLKIIPPGTFWSCEMLAGALTPSETQSMESKITSIINQKLKI